MDPSQNIPSHIQEVEVATIHTMVATMDARPSDGACAFDKLFARSVPHILEEIFLSLDYESLKGPIVYK